MRPALAFMLVCAVSGCGTEPSPRVTAWLREAPTSVTLDGHPFELSVYLYRDFMPASPPNGRPLAAVVRLPAELAAVRVERVWVVLGNEVWGSAVEHIPGTLDWVARDGPKWGPGVSVDVVARLRDTDGNEVLVRAADRVIQRTD